MFFFSADVTTDAVLVPLLNRRSRAPGRADDVHVVEPLAPLNVPAWRQHDDPSLFDCCQIVLNAPAAERVFDAMLLEPARQVRFADKELAARAPAELEAAAVQRDAA